MGGEGYFTTFPSWLSYIPFFFFDMVEINPKTTIGLNR